jgi:hypothetical protein
MEAEKDDLGRARLLVIEAQERAVALSSLFEDERPDERYLAAGACNGISTILRDIGRNLEAAFNIMDRAELRMLQLRLQIDKLRGDSKEVKS